MQNENLKTSLMFIGLVVLTVLMSFVIHRAFFPGVEASITIFR